MGGLGLAGLWLLLGLVVAVSIALAIGSVWLANKTVYRQGSKEQSGSLSPLLTTAALVYGALLGFTRRRRVGAILLCRGNRYQ